MSLLEKAFVLITDDPNVESSLKHSMPDPKAKFITLPHHEVIKVEDICCSYDRTVILVHTSGGQGTGQLMNLMEFRKKISMDNVEIVFFSELKIASDIISTRDK